MPIRKAIIAPPGSDLSLAIKDVQRRPGRKVTIELTEPLLGSVKMVAEGAGITLEAACLVILNRAINDALRPLQGRALELAKALGGVLVPDPSES